jgi:stage II sporulation protein AA (anti-sigma F factor antagonist)
VTLLATVSEERHGDVALAVVEGEVDASNADALSHRLRTMLTNRSHALVVDLGATTYIDSAGINLIFALAADLRERQQRLYLVVAPGATIGRAIAICGLDVAVPTHPSRDAALDAARSPDGPAR